MKIGLVRHFKVNHQSSRKRMTGEEFNRWMEEYNTSDIYPGEFVHGGQEWEICLSSSMSRAACTAAQIFPGTIEYTEQLREVQISAVKKTGLRLPPGLWLALGHIFWQFGHSSQPELRTAALQRARTVIDRIEREHESSNVLIVSHGAFMMLLAKELRARGYQGRRIFNPRNGGLYVYRQ